MKIILITYFTVFTIPTKFLIIFYTPRKTNENLKNHFFKVIKLVNIQVD